MFVAQLHVARRASRVTSAKVCRALRGSMWIPFVVGHTSVSTATRRGERKCTHVHGGRLGLVLLLCVPSTTGGLRVVVLMCLVGLRHTVLVELSVECTVARCAISFIGTNAGDRLAQA